MRRSFAAAGALGLALFLSSCADAEVDTPATSPAPMTETASPEETTSPEDTASPTGTAGGQADIMETVEEADGFTVLTGAIEAAGLDDDLKGPGPFTVFAPRDGAFDSLPEGTLDRLLEDPDGKLAEILTYHIIADEVSAAEASELDGQRIATLQGAELTVEVEGSDVILVDSAGNRATVVTPDIEASNGVIHAIDGVLLPPE